MLDVLKTCLKPLAPVASQGLQFVFWVGVGFMLSCSVFIVCVCFVLLSFTILLFFLGYFFCLKFSFSSLFHVEWLL